ncbi:hypothetical protein ACWGTI_09425 [Mesorhizobium sp. ArgA1]
MAELKLRGARKSYGSALRSRGLDAYSSALQAEYFRIICRLSSDEPKGDSLRDSLA